MTKKSIGNLTNKSDLGGYTYVGTGYANPHAATTVNGVTYTYDNNGNLTADGTHTYTWNYRNAQTLTEGSATSTYAYDHTNQRIRKGSATATTTYPNCYYNRSVTAGGVATTTLSIMTPDGLLLGTIEGNGTATSTYFVHPDHLGSTHLVTDSTALIEQTLDCKPFGAERINSGTDVSQREFIGEEGDEETSLSYLNARYDFLKPVKTKVSL